MQVSILSSLRSTADPDFAIEMVNDCLTAALDLGASDVHLQPRSDHWDVSFRVDGVLLPVDSFERSEHSDPVSRLMSLAGLPSYRAGIPQEAPLRWRSEAGEDRELRLGIFPTVHGNRAAIRIMDSRESVRNLDQLGFDSETHSQLQSICDSRDGWLLVAGPAGSGKTTTLYACLSHIAAGNFPRSILSIEDPIESVIDAFSQTQLQPDSGLTLASAMRAAVRQDAEVLLVSEIRDVDTAEAVLAASMTGHLCFSSIHAGSIGATLHRLQQMKLPTFAIQSGLRGILCQRLLRQTCPTCSNEKGSFDQRTVGPESACADCHGTGYCGRTPISQFVSFDGASLGNSIFEALASGRTAREIDDIASRSGVDSLHDQADRMVDAGQTDATEVFRVLGRRT